MLRNAVALAALACAGSAVAQTSNCMNIGGGMVHCDNMGANGTSSSTDCTSIGGGMATCNTTGTGSVAGQPRAGGSTTLGVIAEMIAQSRERSLQKKVGLLLAAGDCQGAANLAIAKGRADLGLQIRQSCAPAGARQALTFDLLCNGTVTQTSMKSETVSTPYTRQFRVDLSQERYCDGDCATTSAIYVVGPKEIVFYLTDNGKGWGGSLSVNRETATLSGLTAGASGWTEISAKCERQPFSGFPAVQF